MKRLVDIIVSLVGLVFASPILLPVMYLVWLQDKCNPFYIAPRVGLNGRLFNMVKLRSMIVNADRTGVDSTSLNDMRITPVGHFIRRYKLDELTQLWNVLIGDMSLVGPRPNVEREVALYTDVELNLLSMKPGITDFSSIVFSDEGEILKDQVDPDIAYHQLIRPYKSLLGIFYVENNSLIVDLYVILLTIFAIFKRELALKNVVKLLRKLGAPELLCVVSERSAPLVPRPPPGASAVVTNRNNHKL